MSAPPAPPAGPCPDESALTRLVLGSLPPPEAEPLASHVERCERCTAAAAAIAEERAGQRRGGRERRLVAGTRTPRRSRPWFWASLVTAVALGALLAVQQGREPLVVELAPPSGTAGARGPRVRAFARLGDELRELQPPEVALPAGARVRLALDGLAGHQTLALACHGERALALWPPTSPRGPTDSQRFRPEDRGFGASDVAVEAGAPLTLLLLAGPTPIPAAAASRACAAVTAGGAGRAWPAATFEWRLRVTPAP